MGSLSDILGSGLGTEASSSLESIIGGATGSLLETAIGDAASIVPFIGPVIQAITAFIGLGGGCGEACIASSKGEQVFEVAGDDILHTVKNGMLDGADGVLLLGTIKHQGEAFLTKLIEQGDQKAQDGLSNMGRVIDNLVNVAKQYDKATQQLDLQTAQDSYISTSNQGWYVESVVSGNALATQILQAYLQAGTQGVENADLSQTLNTILNSLSNELVKAQNGASSTMSNILGGIAGLLGIAQAGSSSTGTKVLSGILGTIGLSSNTANAIASDVSSALGDVTKTIDILNKDIIGKLVNPVLESINKAETLQTALTADLKNGLTGILQIPSQLAGYLTSQEQIAKQTVELTNENQNNIANSLIDKGFEQNVGVHIKNSIQNFTDIFGEKLEGLNELRPVNLTEPFDLSGWKEFYQSRVGEQDASKNIFKWLGLELYKAALFIEKATALIGNDLKMSEQSANVVNPVSPLGPGEIIDAVRRGLLNDSEAELEMLRNGISPDRYKVLYESADTLLSVREILDGLSRGVISEADATREFDNLNVTTERQVVLKELINVIQDPQTAFNWYRRGGFSEEVFTNILKAQHWTDEDINIAKQYLLRVPSSSELARFHGRIEASQKGFLTDSYNSDPPGDLQALNKDNQFEDRNAGLNWLAHWRDLGLFDYVNALYRGLIDKNMFDNALTSLNIPPELNQLVEDVNRPLIPFFYLTEMLAAGIFTEEQARSVLAKYGYDETNIDAAIRFGNFKAIGKATDQNTALAQLSVSQLKTMYDDNIIDKSQLIISLQEHGYNPTVATLLAELYETNKQLSENKTYAQMIVDNVKLGRITKLEALDDLNSRGYTQAQIAAYDLEIENIKTSNGKLPTKSEFDAFWKANLIDDSAYIDALTLIGYSTEFATLFLALLQGVGNANN